MTAQSMSFQTVVLCVGDTTYSSSQLRAALTPRDEYALFQPQLLYAWLQ